MKTATQKTERPDWAPDDCPDDVIEMIDIDNELNLLGLRGLSSADSKRVRTGWRRLCAQFEANYKRGRRDGLAQAALVGSVLVPAVFALGWLLA